jgi:hypothetical protein
MSLDFYALVIVPGLLIGLGLLGWWYSKLIP